VAVGTKASTCAPAPPPTTAPNSRPSIARSIDGSAGATRAGGGPSRFPLRSAATTPRSPRTTRSRSPNGCAPMASPLPASPGFPSARLQWLVDYGCRDDYGLRAEDTSAWAGLFYFCSRIPRPGAESRALLTWPEGNGRLVGHLYAAAREHVQLGTAAAEVIP